MESNRKATPQEEKLLEILVKKASINIPLNWKDKLLVRPMEDGQMGSLHLFPNGLTDENRLFGQQVSEHQFTDIDGVDVIASLYLDGANNLFELDMWKTNFSPLIKIPELLE